LQKTNLKVRLTLAFYLSLLFVVCFGILTVFVLGDKLTAFDMRWIERVQGLETPALTAIMKFFTFVGSTAVVMVMSAVILLVLYFGLRHRAEAVLFLAVMAGSGILNQAFKLSFHRLRPDFHRLIEITGYSFPSGHSMSAFAFYGILTFLLWRHVPSRPGRTLVILIGTAMTLAIGLSRVYLGVHYPSDVIGGFLAGGFWLIASIWVYQEYQESKSSSYAMKTS
jgi:undecaprenyl-diphosphatase